MRQVIVAEQVGTQWRVLVEQPIELGQEVRIGREREIPVAHLPRDTHVSRQAMRVTASPDGWLVKSDNRNGLIVRPWAQPTWQAQPTELIDTDRVALRVMGDATRMHWVLLENVVPRPRRGAPVIGPGASVTVQTDLAAPPNPLTGPQVEVLCALFAGLVSWPPLLGTEPRQLKQVARQTGISVSGVQARLKEVLAKAQGLGLARQVSTLSDPEYLYVLVRAGYLRFEDCAEFTAPTP